MNILPKYWAAIALLLMLIGSSYAMTDLDYSLGGSRSGRESHVSKGGGFHGDGCVWLSAETSESGSERYGGIYVHSDEPIQARDLDSLSFWMEPLEGNGQLVLEILLDANGDGKYTSPSKSKDLILKGSMDGFDIGQWNEIDAFDMSFNATGSSALRDLGPRDLGSWLEDLGDMGFVSLRIKLYSGTGKTGAFFDYIRVGREVLSFEPLETQDVKKGPKTAVPGGKITYTITFGNNYSEPIDLVVTEQYDQRTIFLTASVPPDAGTENVWTIRGLMPGEHRQIKVSVRTLKLSCKAEITGSVSGEGYTTVSRRMSGDTSGYEVMNTVTISSARFNTTATKTTAIRAVEGSRLSFDEHGPGSYRSDERLQYSPSRISARIDLLSRRSPVSLALPGGSMAVNGSWYALQEAGISTMGASHIEIFSPVSALDLTAYADLQKKKLTVETRSTFTGNARFETGWSGAETRSDFSGNFSTKVRETLREYGKDQTPYKGWLDCPLPEGCTDGSACPGDICPS